MRRSGTLLGSFTVIPETIFPASKIALILRCVLITFLACQCVSAANHVQQASVSDASGTPYSSISARLIASTAAGDSIIVGLTFGNTNTTISITDTAGNSYIEAVQIYDSNHRQGSAVFYATNIAAAAQLTVTANFTSSVAYLAFAVHEYSGVAGLDVASAKLGSGNSLSSGSVSTTANGDLVFGVGVEDARGYGDAFTPGLGFTKRIDLGSLAAYADEDLTQSAAASIATTWTLSPTNDWISAIVAFKPAGSGTANSGAPTIYSLNPSSGPVGSSITIAGENFGSNPATVKFGNVPGSPTSWNPTTIVVPVPAEAVSGNVTVTVGNQTSNGVGFSVTKPVVTVNPATASVPKGLQQTFAATVQNDPQNRGVTWSVSGSGCTGVSCGTLSMPSPTSVTYLAPNSPPNPASVTLRATSVSDPTTSAVANVTISDSADSISVTVTPQAASVPVSSSTVLTASVQNDPEGKGVTWSVGGAGCAGSSCGTLSNVSASSATFNAPIDVPNPPSVSVTATAVSDGSKSASATITVTSTTGNSLPTFAENHVSGSSTQGDPVSSYTLRLPNRSLSGNCIVVGFQYSDGAPLTAQVSDDVGNTYNLGASHGDGNQVVNIAYALNVSAGAQKITITFAGRSPDHVTAVATEFYNVAAANALDTSTGNSAASTTVSAGTLTTSASNDLLYQYAVQDSSSNPMERWTQGALPWTLLSADILDGAASQYQIQTSAGSITPTLSMSPSQSFNSVAIALKPQSSGTAPPAGIRVIRVQHNSVPPYAANPVNLQFPSTGNLVVVSWIGVSGHDINGVSDGNGNPYHSAGPAFGYGLSGDNQIYYAPSASTGTTMTGPTLSTTGDDISGSTAVLLDIRGAASAPFDSAAGLATSSATQNSSGPITGPTIAPSVSCELVISSIGVDSNTIVDVAPGNFLSVVPSPVSSPNPVDQNNGWTTYYNSSPGTISFVWIPQGGPVNDWSAIAVAFLAAAN